MLSNLSEEVLTLRNKEFSCIQILTSLPDLSKNNKLDAFRSLRYNYLQDK